MNKDLQIASRNELVKNKEVVSCNINQYGNDNTQIAHVDNYHEGSIIVSSPNRCVQNRPLISNNTRHNCDYFNLFVIGDESYEGSYFYVPKEKALTESIATDIRERYSSLSVDAVNEIKKFPSVFCSENHRFAKTDINHCASLGMISDVEVQSCGIKISFSLMFDIPQTAIIKMSDALMIEGTEFNTELCRTHWTIKKVNLIQTLQEAGYWPY